MKIYAQNSCTIGRLTDVKATYTYYYLSASGIISSDQAPKNKSNTSAGNKPDGNPITVSDGVSSYTWTTTEPTVELDSGQAVGQLYRIECALFSNDEFQWGPVITASSYSAAKSAYNKASNAVTTITEVQNNVKKVWTDSTGSYIASGVLKNGTIQDVTKGTETTYGFNSKLAPASLEFRYNNQSFIEMGLNSGAPSLKFYTILANSGSTTNPYIQGPRAMELTNSALTFYGISTDSLPTASLGSDSLDFYGYSLTNDEVVGEKTYYTKTYDGSTPIYTEATLEPGANPAILGLYTYGAVSSFGQSRAEIGGFTIENNLLKLDAEYQLDNNTSVMTERIRFGFLNSHIGENARGQSDSSDEQEIDDDETTNTIEEDEFGLEIYTPLTAGYILTTDTTYDESKVYYLLNKLEEEQEESYKEVTGENGIQLVWLESYSDTELFTYIQTSHTLIDPETNYYNENKILCNPNTLNWKEHIEETIVIEDDTIISGGGVEKIRLGFQVFLPSSVSESGIIVFINDTELQNYGIRTTEGISYLDVTDITLNINDVVRISYYTNSTDTIFNLEKNYYTYSETNFTSIDFNNIHPNDNNWFVKQTLTWENANNTSLPTQTGSTWPYQYILTNYKINLSNNKIVYYNNPTVYATPSGIRPSSSEEKIITSIDPSLIGLYETNNTIISQPVFHVDSTNNLTIGYGDKTVTWDNGELSIQADNIYAYQNGSRINILEILTELQELGSQSEDALLGLQENFETTSRNLTESIRNLANSATQDYVDNKLLNITNSITNIETDIENIQNDMVVTNAFFENLNSYIEIDTVNNIFSLKNANSSISQAINFGKDNISIESDLSSHPILRINDDNMVQTDYLTLGGFEEDTENTESNESNEDTESTASGFRWQYDYSDNTLRLKEL